VDQMIYSGRPPQPPHFLLVNPGSEGYINDLDTSRLSVQDFEDEITNYLKQDWESDPDLARTLGRVIKNPWLEDNMVAPRITVMSAVDAGAFDSPLQMFRR